MIFFVEFQSLSVASSTEKHWLVGYHYSDDACKLNYTHVSLTALNICRDYTKTTCSDSVNGMIMLSTISYRGDNCEIATNGIERTEIPTSCGADNIVYACLLQSEIEDNLLSWPAVATYDDTSSCDTLSTMVTAFNPQCNMKEKAECSRGMLTFGAYMDEECSPDAADYVIMKYETEICNTSTHGPYYASCNGALDIPMVTAGNKSSVSKSHAWTWWEITIITVVLLGILICFVVIGWKNMPARELDNDDDYHLITQPRNERSSSFTVSGEGVILSSVERDLHGTQQSEKEMEDDKQDVAARLSASWAKTGIHLDSV